MTKETDYFKTFCKISKAFGTAITKQELLDLVVSSAIDTMAGKAACLFLQDRKAGYIRTCGAGRDCPKRICTPVPLRPKISLWH
jgi:hypothetical protein